MPGLMSSSGGSKKGLLVANASSITASEDGWYVFVGAVAAANKPYNPDFVYSTNGSNVTVYSDRLEGNADGGYGDLCVRVYLKKGQYIKCSVQNGSGNWRSNFFVYQGKV